MKPLDHASAPSWSFRIWLACVAVLTLIVTVLLTAGIVSYAHLNGPALSKTQTDAVLALANLPFQMKAGVLQLLSALDNDPDALLIAKKATERSHWQRVFPAAEDTGYLLFSGVDKDSRDAMVSLIRIADGKVIARWLPDWQQIIGKTTPTKYSEGLTLETILAVHPVLMPNGDVIFNTSGAMVRMSSCSRQPRWVLDEVMHHSNELDGDGNIWAPSVSFDGFADNPWLLERVRDDALAKVSPDGKLLERHSLAKIMRANGLQALLLGTQGHHLNDDPIHLNQITVAQTTTPHWQRGDLLLSARHSSTVFLYRPSTGRVVWHQTGPWMNQHSVEFVGDHQISVFNNNVYSGATTPQPFLAPGDINGVMLYDFQTGQVTEPYASLLARAKPLTKSAGRARILPDGGLFVEDTNFGRHLRFSRDRLMWSRVNDYDDSRIGLVSWSRYLTSEEAAGPLKALADLKCQASP